MHGIYLSASLLVSFISQAVYFNMYAYSLARNRRKTLSNFNGEE